MQENTKQEPQISNANPSGPTNSTPEVKEELSKVSSNPKRNMLVMASMVMGFAVMAYNLLAPIFFTKNKNDDVPVPDAKNITTPSNISADLPPIPQVPEPPKLIAPTPPPPPAAAKVETPPPPVTSEPPFSAPPSLPPTTQPNFPPTPTSRTSSFMHSSYKDEDAAKQRAEAKRKSSIVLVGGTPPKEVSEISKEQGNDFKKRGDLEYVLGQGKIMDAVVESAINSDFQGEIRAVISRDVYSENAKVILIPKGTRIFGTFQAGDTSGRVTVTWNKINLESGYTLTMASNAVDNLGRKGIQGRVDHKYTEQMTNALLTSAFNVAVASGLDKIVPPVTSTATASQSASNIGSLTTLATGIAADPNTNNTYPVVNGDAGAAAKIATICTQGKTLITDTTSPTYIQFNQACTTAQAPTGGTTPQQALSSLVATITGLATTSAQSAVANATPTQAQQASKQAFTDITTAAKNMVGQVQFKPTVTIDQGTQIKIYVNKDYVFPKEAINKTKVIH